MIIEEMQYDDFGKYIKEQRKKSGKTLNGFAFENDIEPAVLSRVENQKQDIKLNVLIKIAKGFGKTAGEFLTEYEKSDFSGIK